MTDEIKRDAIQGEIIHEYDGIEEADNRLPQWWLWTFYVAIAFSLGYWVYYESIHVGAGPLDRYVSERTEAMDSGGPVTDDELVGLTGDRLALRAGEKAFGQNCAKCHGARAEGNIGPNLTDEYWLGDDTPSAIFATIADGRTGKGMPAWGLQLGRASSKQIAAYLLSVRGTNLPGRAPQGEKRTASPQHSTGLTPPAATPTSITSPAR